jgi:hypothetical protein
VNFRYLGDPLFLFCVGLYFVNRFIFKKIWLSGFAHEHLNDLICIPFWVPIMLFVQRRLGLRDGDDSPRPSEIIIPLIMWSWIFEVILPNTEWFRDYCVADYLDILSYTVGALGAAIIWRWWYG